MEQEFRQFRPQAKSRVWVYTVYRSLQFQQKESRDSWISWMERPLLLSSNPLKTPERGVLCEQHRPNAA